MNNKKKKKKSARLDLTSRFLCARMRVRGGHCDTIVNRVGERFIVCYYNNIIYTRAHMHVGRVTAAVVATG